MKKSLIVFALILSLIYSVGGIYFYFIGDKKPKNNQNISEISNYGYVLKSSATSLMKEEFNILKTNLESEEINDQDYASSIAKLFIIDVYTMINKENKYDVGGTDYVMSTALENYKLNITDTIYKYMENNSDKKRKQKLPEVSSINIEEIEETEMKIKEDIYKGYKINLNWNYVEDLDYNQEAEVIVIKDNQKYVIAEKK